MTDASSVAVSAALFQIGPNGNKEALGFVSHKLSVAQQKYSTYDCELFAMLPFVSPNTSWKVVENLLFSQTLNLSKQSLNKTPRKHLHASFVILT